MLLKMKDCLLGKKPGFSLLEVMIAVVLMGIITAIALPSFYNRSKKYERARFITSFNTLVGEAQQIALEKNLLVRVFLDFTTRKITVEKVIDPYVSKKEYEPVTLLYADNNFVLPESQKIEQFFVQGKDSMSEYEQTNTVWFFIVPSGTAQSVIINSFDMSNDAFTQAKPYSLVLNPLTAQWREYYEFQTPAF